jgi:MFS family permease
MAVMARRTSLWPVTASFVLFGAYAGAFSAAALDIERTFDLSDSDLGVVLAAGILCATALNAVGGVLTDRWGARVTMSRALIAWALLMGAEAASPHVALFVLAFVAATSAGGLLDVVMNVVAAAALAREPGRLVRFHALFNGGAVLGAAATGLVLDAGASWRWLWGGIAVVGIVLAATSLRVPIPSPPPSEHPSILRALASLRHEGLVVLGLVFAASAMVEGGVATFGVLYLRANLDMSVSAGVGAYVVGQALATVTRAGAGPIVGALGTRRGVALAGGTAAAGIALEALSPTAVPAAIGLAVACIGIAVVWPLLIAAVSNEARHPALAIGGVTASGYLGMVAGPALVGAAAGLFGLDAGLLLLVAAALFVAVTPAHVRGPRLPAGPAAQAGA